MRSNPARATDGANHLSSTPGTPAGRARRWPVWVGILAVGALALAAPMVAAEPASAPLQGTATSAAPARAVAERTTTTQAGPTEAEIRTLNEAILANKLKENAWIAKTKERQAAEAKAAEAAKAAEQAKAAKQAAEAKARAAEQARAAAAPAPSSGRCGGNLPPCWVMRRESGGNIRAKNPSSSASGKWQFIDSTWAGYGGYAHAWQAPESVQDAKAAQLWAGGAGCGHWGAC